MAGKSRFIVNATPEETRIAFLEDNQLVELFIEREKEKGIVGNIYKGVVKRILPGMEAAFVDIGLERTAFLYVDEILSTEEQFQSLVGENGEAKHHDRKHRREKRKIQDLLKEGQEILVQIVKNPVGTKGARLTCQISLPGRYVVLMPTLTHVGISRQIQDEKQRRELRDVIEKIRPPDMGLIVRTVADTQKLKPLKWDLYYLKKLWWTIQKTYKKSKAPALIHADLNLALRTVRDRLTEEVDCLYVDDKQVYKELIKFVKSFNPQLKKIIKLHTLEEPIFDVYGIEKEINRALSKKVWLKSGGYLIIDQAEALTVIDVNTGRYVGKRNLEETLVRTNLEAAQEIAYQIRLRNCAGIIIIDFIDMEERRNRERVYEAFEDAVRQDKAQSHILGMSELGLIQMTRKRTRETLLHAMTEGCPYCDGRGFIKNQTTIILDIWRNYKKLARQTRAKKIEIKAHPEIIETIETKEESSLQHYSRYYRKEIVLVKDSSLHLEQFHISHI